jgi:hypothetical protein
MPSQGKGIKTQRARWEGGRFRMIRSAAPDLLGRVLRGRGRFVEPLLDLLLLPLGLHVALLVIGLASPQLWLRMYGAFGLAVAGGHVLSAITIGGGGWCDLEARALAPFYILSKICMLPSILCAARRDAPWVRTEREGKGTVQV